MASGELSKAQFTSFLISTLKLAMDNGKLRVELYGELAALLNLANDTPTPEERGCK
jgi:hypothetical protein